MHEDLDLHVRFAVDDEASPGSAPSLESALVGFVQVAWDGGSHAFVLDTVVHPDHQRRGIGRELVLAAATEARRAGCHWLHVDYEPHLQPFYRDSCGFRTTDAGLLDLSR